MRASPDGLARLVSECESVAASSYIKSFLKDQKPTAARDLRWSVGFSIGNGLLVIVQAWIVASIVADVVFKEADLAAVMPSLLLLLPLFALRAGLVWAADRAGFRAAAAVRRDLRARAVAHLRAVGPVGLAEQPTGGLVAALTDSLSAIDTYYSRYLPAVSLVVMMPLAVLVAVTPFDWLSAIVFVVTAPFIPLFMVLIGAGAERLNQRQWRKLARMSGHLLDVIQGLTTLKIFNASRREAAEVARMAEAYRRDTMSVLRLAFLSSLALEFFATVSIAIVAVLIGFRLLWGEMVFFNGFFVLLLAPEFYLPLRNLGAAYHARMEAVGAAERVTELLAIPVRDDGAGGTDLPGADAISIRFEDVEVSFADGRRALDGVSFEIAAGERVALVGPSGAGKTTVLNLLLGFVRPTAGRILINGVPLDKLDLAAWRRHIAYLPQRPHIYHASARDNIAMAPADAVVDEARVVDAARKARADDVIRALPNGYDTLLHERGEGLSGGEAQRIGLARAFHRDALLVVMDEATAHLDYANEAVIAGALDALAVGRTMVVVAHRPATVRKADRVIRLDAGKVIAAEPALLDDAEGGA